MVGIFSAVDPTAPPLPPSSLLLFMLSLSFQFSSLFLSLSQNTYGQSWICLASDNEHFYGIFLWRGLCKSLSLSLSFSPLAKVLDSKV